MSTRIFVGSLAWATDHKSLKAYFEQVGPVEEATVLADKMTGRSRGFGFVTMKNDADAAAAIAKLNGTELDGRKIIVSEAKPRTE
jgi:RNA recognition motif-containing protein